MSEQELQEQLNKVWSGWVIKELVGEGSYGKVYRIERDEFGHVYESALKVMTIPQSQAELKTVINEGMDEESAKSYFYSIVKEIVEEFTLMARLKGNTNIVSYEDHAVVENEDSFGWNIFIRMELLTPLLDHFRENTTSVRNIVKLGIDICSALEICQQYNIIHRDVKPENIFVSGIGSYKLGDFGIARQLEKTSASMSRKGTMNYMAPEVYKGEKYDLTVDLYSLGLVLYRFLNNNRMPFLPPYPQPILYSDKEEANIKRMSGLQLPLPNNAHGKLADIIIKACEFDPKGRYKSPSDMKRDLMSVLYGEDEKVISVNAGEDRPKITYSSKDSMDMASDESDGETVAYTDVEEPIVVTTIAKSDKVVGSNKPTKPDKAVVGKMSVQSDKTVVDNRIRKTGLIVGIAITVVLVVVGVIGYVLLSDKDNMVPSLVNMNMDEALKLVEQEEYGFALEPSGEEYSDTIEEGDIISQDIAAGTTAEKGTIIHVVVSKGQQITVPNLVGFDTREAENILVSAGLVYKVKEEIYSDDVESGRIISQETEAGTKVEPGQTVYVTVSKGEELITVPDVTGKTYEEAEQMLTGLNLTVESEDAYDDNVASGNIVSQDIESGKEVKKGTTVKLVKSLGKKPVVKSPATPRKSSNSGDGDDDVLIWD